MFGGESENDNFHQRQLYEYIHKESIQRKRHIQHVRGRFNPLHDHRDCNCSSENVSSETQGWFQGLGT